MTSLDLTLPTPEENLAGDEALLDWCEAGAGGELLRFWEPLQYFVVVGYANKVDCEVNVRFCQENGIPILRRCSGGGTVLQGPGCMNYSLILEITESGPLRSIHATNQFVLERHQAALGALLGKTVERQGHTDLTVEGLKFSGNAQRRKKRFLLFHGSFLLAADIGLIQRALPMPTQQPDYRVNRPHRDFLRNLPLAPTQVKAALRAAWSATDSQILPPKEQISHLAQTKYARPEWNFRF